jgi:hypothetical protein
MCSEGLYIGQGVGDKGGQKVAGAGALEVCKGHAGHGGLGGVLEGCCLSGGVLSVGAGEVAMVGDVQGAEGEERGVLGAFFLFLPYLTAWVRAGEAGLDRGDVHEHGHRVEASENSDAHSELDFLRFLSARCSIKCPQEFEFQIFENGHCGLSRYWSRVPELFLF